MRLLFRFAVMVSTSALLLVPMQAVVAGAPESATQNFDKANYDAAIARLRAGDLANVDMRWLRMERSRVNGYYFSDWELKERSVVYDLLDKGQSQAARDLVSKRLAVDFLDPRAQVTAAVVGEKLGLKDQAELHGNIVKTFTASIRRGKRGRSAEDSWEAANTGEEYFILWWDRYEFRKQMLRNVNGHMYDVMLCLDQDTKQEVEIWFEIDSFFGKRLKSE